VEIAADIALPASYAISLKASENMAEAFMKANCFEPGEGLYDMVYIKEFLSGIWMNAFVWLQVGVGLFGLCVHIAEYECTCFEWIDLDLRCCCGESPKHEERICRKRVVFAWLCAAFALGMDFADLHFNVVPLVDKFNNIQTGILGNGELGDGSKAVFFFPMPEEVKWKLEYGRIIGTCLGVVGASFFAVPLIVILVGAAISLFGGILYTGCMCICWLQACLDCCGYLLCCGWKEKKSETS